MTTKCPYCGDLVTGEIVELCHGCGNPVALSSVRKLIRRSILTHAENLFRKTKTQLFLKITDQ